MRSPFPESCATQGLEKIEVALSPTHLDWTKNEGGSKQALIPRKDDVSSEIRSLDVQPFPFPLLQVEWIL